MIMGRERGGGLLGWKRVGEMCSALTPARGASALCCGQPAVTSLDFIKQQVSSTLQCHFC